MFSNLYFIFFVPILIVPCSETQGVLQAEIFRKRIFILLNQLFIFNFAVCKIEW